MTQIDRVEPCRLSIPSISRYEDSDAWVNRACRIRDVEVPTNVLRYDFNAHIHDRGWISTKVQEILEKKQRTVALIHAFDSGSELAEWLIINGVTHEKLRWGNIKNDEVFSLCASKVEIIRGQRTFIFRKGVLESADLVRTELFVGDVCGIHVERGVQNPLPKGFKTSVCDLCVTWEF